MVEKLAEPWVHNPFVDTPKISLPDWEHYPRSLNAMSSTPTPPKSENSKNPIPEAITQALTLFDLTPPFSPTTLYQRYQDLLLTWHPHRYANMTNNPSKYMKMYKKGEAMTKKIRAAYQVLKEWS